MQRGRQWLLVINQSRAPVFVPDQVTSCFGSFVVCEYRSFFYILHSLLSSCKAIVHLLCHLANLVIHPTHLGGHIVDPVIVHYRFSIIDCVKQSSDCRFLLWLPPSPDYQLVTVANNRKVADYSCSHYFCLLWYSWGDAVVSIYLSSFSTVPIFIIKIK
jgi:hypothetical protein